MEDKYIQESLKKINSIENAINNPAFDLNTHESYKLNIQISKKVPHGLFKPNPKIEGNWLASAQTFRAMKKDIFALEDSVDELKEPYLCQSCKSNIDKQFWHFCPHCSAEFQA